MIRVVLSKAATTLSFLFAVLFLLSLPGAGSEGNLANFKRVETNTSVSLTAMSDIAKPAAAGFSYSRWLASGQPAAHENRASGTFILKTAAGDIYRSRLTAAWRDVGARALNIEPLLRDELLLLANNKDSHWQSAWKNHREALLPALVDGTSDALLGGVLESGRALSWVRHLEVDFRTKLGKRPGSFGVNAILALHERADDATGLQLRGFFGNKFKGANAGVFYRRALGDNLLGGNVFLDYESADVGGDFWRWSLGAEWRSPYVELYGNRYLGITGGKRQLVGGQYIYTADGTEVELVLKAPYASWLSGVLSYYRWDGEYGDKVDKGFRYGIRADRRLGGFSFELQYEDPEVGKGSWGGRVSYSHDFAKGAESASSTQALTFDPRAHFFDAVRREYTQRIRKTAGNVFTGRIRIFYLDGRATIVGSELTLQIYGSGETFTTELALISAGVNAGVTTIVTGTVLTQTISPPNDYFITATALLTAFTESPSTLRISVNNWEIELHSELVFAFASSPMLLRDGELMVMRNDGGMSVVALANGRPTINLANALISIATGGTVFGGSVDIQLTEGLASLVLNANNTLNALVRNGTLIVSLAAGSNITAELESVGNGLIALLSGNVSVGIVTTNLSPLAGRLVNASAVVTTGYAGRVAQVTATGGGSLSYAVIFGGNNFAVGATDGWLSLAAAQSASVTLTASVQISDTGILGVRASPVTVGYTVVVGEAFVFSSAQPGVATITTYDTNLVLLTASVAGALGAVVYTRISANPAGLAANFAVSLDGVVNVQQAFPDPTTLSLVIRAAEETINGAERLATLLLTVAVVDPPAFVAALNSNNPVVITGYSGSVAQVNSSGGKGMTTYTIQPAGGALAVGTAGRIDLRSAVATPATLIATLVADDGHPNTPAVTLNLTVAIVDALGFAQNRVDIRLTTYGTVPVALHTAVAINPSGGGAITYSLLRTDPPGFSATINFTPSSEGGMVSLIAALPDPISASIYIRATTDSDKATLILALAAVDPPAIVAAFVNALALIIFTGETGLVASVSVTGGAGAYTYAVGNGFAVGADGLLSLTLAQVNDINMTATVIVNDGHDNTAPVNIFLTLMIGEAVSFSHVGAAFTLTTHDDVPIALFQASLQGGVGAQCCILVSTNPIDFGANISLDNGGGIMLRRALSSPVSASVYVRGWSAIFGGASTLLLTVIAVDPPAFMATLDSNNPVVVIGHRGSVAQVNSSGGKGTTTYTIQPAGGALAVGTVGRIDLRSAVATPATLTATLVADDGHPNTPPVTLNLTVEIVDALVFSPNRVDIRLTTHGTVSAALHTAVAINPRGNGVGITYSLISTSPPGFSATINFTPSSEGGVVSLITALPAPISASIYIRATTSGDKATLILALAAVDPPAFSATLVQSNPMIFTGYSGSVAQVNSSGGAGTYTYTIQPVGGNLTVGTNGRVTLLTAQATPATLIATLVADDHPDTPPVTLSLTLAVLAEPAFVNASAAVLTAYTGPVASIVNAPSGNWTLVAGANHFTVETNGLLRLTAVIAVSSTLTASIAVDVSPYPTITLGYILTVAPCSFFNGCQPFVNFNGAPASLDESDRSAAWATLSAPVAQSLIAAGADVNERVIYNSNEDDTPLLAVTRYGRPAVVAVLLAAGAPVNSVVSISYGASYNFTDVGVLDYVVRNSANIILPLISLFIANGVDVNQRTRLNGDKDRTPLDRYNGRNPVSVFVSAALIINAAGGKCLSNCLTVNGVRDISLAAVSFVPASLTVMAAATFLTGNLYTVRAASGLGTRFSYRVLSVLPASLSSSFDLLSVDVNSAILRLDSALEAGVYSVFVEVTDNNPLGDNKATVRYVHVARPYLANASLLVAPAYVGAVASVAGAPSGKWTLVAGGNHFTVGADGLLSLTAEIAVSSILTASIVVDESPLPLITLGYTLNVGACSFFSGCQPFVDHNGAPAGIGAPNSQVQWSAITAPMAQLLIATGADVNERVNFMYNQGAFPIGDDTPLLAATRFGSPAVVSVLLDNGASVNSVVKTSYSHTRRYTDIGVLDYVTNNTPNIDTLISLFIANGVDVNQRTSLENVAGETPLDRYNRNNLASAAAMIRAAGGKCLSTCRTVNGVRDISLAAVSFAPVSLTVTAAAAAGALYPVRAASGLGTLFNYQVVSTFPASLTSNFSLLTVDVNSARLSLNSAPGQDFSVYIEVTDQPSGEKANFKYALRESFSFNPSRLAITEVLDSYFGFAIYRDIKNPSGAVKGLAVGSVTYSLLPTDPLNAPVSLHPHDFTPQDQKHNLYWTEDPAVQTLSIFIQAEDTAGNVATLTLSVAMVAPPALVVTLSGGMRNAITAYIGPVAAVITSGGGGNNSGNGGTTRFSVVFGADNFTVGAGGTISLTAVHNMPTVLTASIAVDNYYLYVDLVPLVTVGYTLSLVVKPALANIFERVALSYTGPVASIVNVLPASGFTVIYGEDNFTVGTDGLLNLTAAITVVSTLTASIVIDLFPPLTLGYTLTVVNVPFFANASLLVSLFYAGAVASIANAPSGGNVNERVIYNSVGDNTPLLAATRYGCPAVVSVLPTTGAPVNSVVSVSLGNNYFTDVGVLDYVTSNQNIDKLSAFL